MTVFVDDARLEFRGMRMSHLMADDLDELHAFAARLGLRREWFQDKSVPHYDVSDSKREQALQLGAVAELADKPSDTLRAVKRAWRKQKTGG